MENIAKPDLPQRALRGRPAGLLARCRRQGSAARNAKGSGMDVANAILQGFCEFLASCFYAGFAGT